MENKYTFQVEDFRSSKWFGKNICVVFKKWFHIFAVQPVIDCTPYRFFWLHR